MAALHEREQQTLARKGVRATAALGLAARAAAIRAFVAGAGPDEVTKIIRTYLLEAAPIVADGMTAAYLAGVARAETTARAAMGVKLSTFDSVLKVLGRRAAMTAAEVQGLIDQYGATAVTTTGEASTYLEDKVSKAVREVIAEGLHREAGVARIRKAFDAAGATVKNPYLYETLYRNEVGKTYSAGRWQANQAPEIQEILWGAELFTVGDDRVRAEHEVMDGKRIPKVHPAYPVLAQPPWDWGCRCSAVEIFADDDALATANLPTAAQIAAAVGPGFGVNWGAVFAPAA
jgi:SPP1 gp7 family putative phage head morphogenesis protein